MSLVNFIVNDGLVDAMPNMHRCFSSSMLCTRDWNSLVAWQCANRSCGMKAGVACSRSTLSDLPKFELLSQGSAATLKVWWVVLYRFCWKFNFQQWKNFENPLRIDKVIAMSFVYYFLGTYCKLRSRVYNLRPQWNWRGISLYTSIYSVLYSLRGSTGLTSIRIFSGILLFPWYNFTQNVISSSVVGSDHLPQISSKSVHVKQKKCWC